MPTHRLATFAVLLGALLAPMVRSGEVDAGADRLLADLDEAARLPRRMAERARMALQAQRLFQGPPRRRRRGGLAAQAYFVDALTLLRVSVKATGEGAEALARWEGELHHGPGREELDPSQLAEAIPEPGAGASPVPAGAPARSGGEAAGATGGAEAGTGAEDDSPDGRRRRRRRGGRRRRRRGQGAGPSAGSGAGGGGDAAPPSAGGA